MTALWTYPWTVFSDGLDATFEGLGDRGVDTLNVAAQYHSAQAFQPRTPESLFESYPAGCYFEPDPERFAETPISPMQNDLPEADDPLAAIVDAAADHGVDIVGWFVLFHNSRLGANNPGYQLEDAFGQGHEHALCPSNPEVQTYCAALAEALASRGVSEIHLESYGFQNVLHSHDTEFGHAMRHVLTGETEHALLSQCFCDGCRARAEEHAVDLAAARDVCQSILEGSLDQLHSSPPPLSTLVKERPVLADLFDFRASVVTDLVAALAEATPETPLNGYVPNVDGSGFRGGWAGGVRLNRLEPHLDRVTAYCYVDDPVEARERVRTIARRTNLTIDAGVTLHPDVIERREQLVDIVGAIDRSIDGRVNVYNHALATETQLDWIEAAVRNAG
jgi:hypothetical protein